MKVAVALIIGPLLIAAAARPGLRPAEHAVEPSEMQLLIDTELANREKKGAAQPQNGNPADAASETIDAPLFVGMLPDEMSQWVEDGGGSGASPVGTPADERELMQEAAALRTAEFVSDIVAALERAEAAPLPLADI
ncbi:hypothetical protein H4R19_006374 [Coemansia spiralis]|nr:hypothetical protein H4R19_006374 [Coemansia spiralis]